VVRVRKIRRWQSGQLTPKAREPTLNSVPENFVKRKTFFAAIALPVMALLFALAAAPRSESGTHDAGDPAHAPAKRISLAGVGNAGEVTPTLFRGAQPSSAGFLALAKIGIAIDVDLRFEGDRAGEKEAATHAGLQYLALPWSCHYPSDATTQKFLSLIHENADKKIFVHCQHGVDRTGMMIAAYRMAEQNWTSEQARGEMIAYGFDQVHRTWCGALNSYESIFPQRYANDPIFAPLRAPAPPVIPAVQVPSQ
jgi:tyrosine-protein phosphatase SIW14